MKIIDKIIESVSDAVQNKKLSFDNYKLLLLKSGIIENDLYDFFAYTEDGINGTIIGISKSHLKKSLVLNKEFFLEFSKNLPSFIEGVSADDKIEFSVEYQPKNRRILVNGIQIKKFHGDKENEQIFEMLFNNPNEEKEVKGKKRTHDLVRAFGFQRDARRLFFPRVNKRTIMFRNNIKMGELKSLKLEKANLKDLFPDI